MIKHISWIILVYIMAWVLITWLLIIGARRLVNKVENVGLKNIVHDIWEGNQ